MPGLQQWRDELSSGRPLCLLAASVVDGTGRDPLADAAVLIDAGRIVEVLPASDLSRSHRETFATVELGDRSIVPGLIDCHTHLVYAGYAIFDTINRTGPEAAAVDCVLNARTLLRAGYTTVRDVGTIGFASVATRDAIAAGKIPGPRVLAGGRSICTTAGPKHEYAAAPGGGFRHYADGPEGVVRAVRDQIRGGVDNIKIVGSGVENNPHVWTHHTTISQEEMQAGISEAHRSGRRVAVHAQSYDAAKFALRAGADTIEHGTRLDEESIALFKSSGAVLVPTLSTLYSVMELGDALNLLPKQREEMARNQPLWRESFQLARESGVPIAAGGDIGNRYPQGTNTRELEHLVSEGMTPLEAIVAATATAARALGRSEEFGTLETGKSADLLVVDGDPVSNISVLGRQEALTVIMQAGVAVAGTDLEHDRTDHLAAAAADTDDVPLQLGCCPC